MSNLDLLCKKFVILKMQRNHQEGISINSRSPHYKSEDSLFSFSYLSQREAIGRKYSPNWPSISLILPVSERSYCILPSPFPPPQMLSFLLVQALKSHLSRSLFFNGTLSMWKFLARYQTPSTAVTQAAAVTTPDPQPTVPQENSLSYFLYKTKLKPCILDQDNCFLVIL